MTTFVSTLDDNRSETMQGASIKLTVVGRSVPYSIRKAMPATATKSNEVHHIRTGNDHHSQMMVEDCYSVMIPAVPLTCRFANQRLATGLRSLLGVIAGITVGAYLATEVSTTPPLHLKVAFVSGVCFLLGLGLVPMTMRDLFGGLRVDSFGIRMTPGVFGFAVPWDELDRWAIDGPAFQFHCRKTNVTHFVHIDHLTAANRQALIDVMRSCVPGREQRKSHSLQSV